MNNSAHYQRDHLIAKAIIYVLYLMVGIASIELDAPYVALVFGTSIWLFGVNTVAYLVECITEHDHHHNPI
jgi:hypothetical protein